MGVNIQIPEGLNAGFYHEFTWGAIGINAHTLQCNQRWLFLLRVGRKKFGYRTKGDATPNLLVYKDAGWYFPWKKKPCSGRY
jgi:hypothetical protein